MREILFRGKAITGKWIYGYYEKYNGGSYINLQTDRLNSGGYPIRDFIDVKPETVGQYTGLTDKNSKKIFEGDIVNIHLVGGIEVGQIIYSEISCRFKFADKYGSTYGFDDTCTFEVIGNIHDNPELLEGDTSDA